MSTVDTWQESEGQLLRAVGINCYCWGFLGTVPFKHPKFPWDTYRSGVWDDDKRIYLI